MLGASEKRELKPTEPFWKASEPSRPSDAAPLQPEAAPDPRPRNSQIEARTLVVGAGIRSRGGSRALHVEAEVSPVGPRPTSEVAC